MQRHYSGRWPDLCRLLGSALTKTLHATQPVRTFPRLLMPAFEIRFQAFFAAQMAQAWRCRGPMTTRAQCHD